ncbi:hypothetical protein QNH10_12890 [Sporosarcina thermotolerans]|uniref:hypothetical protein n=1 Tax=Sporosarcina thermotolerans TaxID=633404 RepID=UPI0024BCCA18|nr:hypothetical protein [Sporosarcina thermotolerans]WHT47152.1 hypothetical protein QNH10_12890 [Sporosarcina thermotolerans]
MVNRDRTGDVNELNVSGGGQLFIDRIRKRTSKMLEDERLADYHLKMIDACGNSNLVITNHSMLLSDSNREQKIFHSFSGLIIDEAHQFIHTAIRSNEIVLSYMNWKYVIGQIGSDAEGQLLHKIMKLHNRFSNFGSHVFDKLGTTYEKFTHVFDDVAYKLSNHRTKARGGQHGNRVIFALDEVRNEPIFAKVAEKMAEYIEVLQTIQSQLIIHKSKMSNREVALLSEWEYWLRELKIKAGEWVEIFLDDRNDNFTVWIEKDKRSLPGSLSIVKSPIDASVMINEFTTRMEKENIGIIWTSGTMTITNNERFVVKQLGISDGVPIKTFAAPQHFYDKAAIFIVDDMPSIQHVSQNDYIEAVADAVVQTVIATGADYSFCSLPRICFEKRMN